MTSNNEARSRIQGTTAPGFESVKRLYEHEMRTMAEKNTQLCVYYRGEKVVDLWASVENDPDFSADSLVNVFSSGKSLECIAIASLVGRGLLSYEAKIADYWPEFAANGKADLTGHDIADEVHLSGVEPHLVSQARHGLIDLQIEAVAGAHDLG